MALGMYILEKLFGFQNYPCLKQATYKSGIINNVKQATYDPIYRLLFLLSSRCIALCLQKTDLKCLSTDAKNILKHQT
jgi:hypothetical protein